MSFFLLMSTKEDILKNDWNIGTIDFRSDRSSKYLHFWVEYPFKKLRTHLPFLKMTQVPFFVHVSMKSLT